MLIQSNNFIHCSLKGAIVHYSMFLILDHYMAHAVFLIYYDLVECLPQKPLSNIVNAESMSTYRGKKYNCISPIHTHPAYSAIIKNPSNHRCINYWLMTQTTQYHRILKHILLSFSQRRDSPGNLMKQNRIDRVLMNARL
jgi:hypothetical protein